jgi:hypothetical protein
VHIAITDVSMTSLVAILLTFMTSLLGLISARTASRTAADAAVRAAAAGKIAVDTQKLLGVIELKIDGRLTQLLEQTAIAKMAMGRAAGVAEERVEARERTASDATAAAATAAAATAAAVSPAPAALLVPLVGNVPVTVIQLPKVGSGPTQPPPKRSHQKKKEVG